MLIDQICTREMEKDRWKGKGEILLNTLAPHRSNWHNYKRYTQARNAPATMYHTQLIRYGIKVPSYYSKLIFRLIIYPRDRRMKLR